jgi:hypothetical protein
MKVRLDRVMKLELTGLTKDEVLAAGGPVPDYADRPAAWRAPFAKYDAPYPPYTPGWWKRFYPPGAQ